MKRRGFSTLVLAALLLALLPGSVWALCGDGLQAEDCCCSKRAAKCPDSSSPRTSESCCSDNGSLPARPVAPAVVDSVTLDPVADETSQSSATAETTIAAHARSGPAERASSRTVPLFTLHAAFLI
ncbi:MAG: hypothetical protein GY716_07500 [bacterium]|nr:hypothetical protein [bacterium]